MERGGNTVATTYASSYDINIRGCSKFVSGPVFLSRKCANAFNRRHCSLLQKVFFWTAPCQLAHIAVLTCGWKADMFEGLRWWRWKLFSSRALGGPLTWKALTPSQQWHTFVFNVYVGDQLVLPEICRSAPPVRVGCCFVAFLRQMTTQLKLRRLQGETLNTPSCMTWQGVHRISAESSLFFCFLLTDASPVQGRARAQAGPSSPPA